MPGAFYAMNGVGTEGVGTEPAQNGGVFAVRVLGSDVEGMDRTSIVRHIERKIRTAAKDRHDARQLVGDLPVEFEVTDGELVAVVNTGDAMAGWVVLKTPGPALTRLSPHRTMLCDRPGARLAYVPADAAEYLPTAPSPQWGASSEGAGP